MALYEDLCAADVLGPISELLMQGRLKLGYNGKIVLERGLLPNQPWIYTRVLTDRRCGKYLQIYFARYRFVPKVCRHCWKVVWTGDRIEQLFKVMELQEEFSCASKCGIEQRAESGKLGKYQGFWYAPIVNGLEGGRSLYRQVVDKLTKEKVLMGPEIILKRGCTEMEQTWPPSEKWDEYAERYDWDRDEALCDALFEESSNYAPEPLVMKVHVLKTWIEYAAAHRDPSVGKFCKKDIILKLMQYQGSIHNEKDYPGLEVGEDRREDVAQAKGEMLDVRGCSGSKSNGGAIITEFPRKAN